MGRGRDHATGTVRVELDAAGRPRFEIAEDVAWDHIPWSDDLGELGRRADAVCFGTLAQRGETSRRTIRRFLATTGPACVRIPDVNLQPPFFDDQAVLDSLRLADAVKLNDEELPVVASMCDLAGSARDVLGDLRQRYDLRLVALTRGAEGAMLLGSEVVVECSGTPVAVKGTVGAGDAFTAAMALGGCGASTRTRSAATPAVWRRSCARRPAGRPRCPRSQGSGPRARIRAWIIWIGGLARVGTGRGTHEIRERGYGCGLHPGRPPIPSSR
jgi:hypothetical protein